MSGDARNELAQMIDEAINRTQKRFLPQPFSVIGEAKISGYCHLPELSFGSSFNIKEHILANMFLLNESERLLLELHFDTDLQLKNVGYCFLISEDIDKYGRGIIEDAAKKLAHQRIEKAREKQKIGRNDPCPCGSGKKYKNCHWRSI